MAEHVENKALKGKTEEDKQSTRPGPVLQDENKDYSVSDSVSNTSWPIVSDSSKHNSYSTNPLDSMVPLLEEESEKPDSEAGKEDMHTVLDPEQSTDTVDVPDIHAGKLDGLKYFLVEEGRQDATSDIGSIIDDASEQQENSENSLDNDTLDDENISTSTNTIGAQAIPPEVHALRGKPGISAEEIPMLLLADEPADAPASQLLTALAIIFALVGMLGAAGALWMSVTLSGHIDQLEAQLSGNQKKNTSIKRSMDELEATTAALKETVLKTVQPTDNKIPTVILPNQSLPPSP